MKNGFIKSSKYLNIKDLAIIIGFYIFINLLSSALLNYGFSNSTDVITPKMIGTRISLSYIVSFLITIVAALFYRQFRTGWNKESLGTFINRSKFSPLLILWGILLILAAQIIASPLTSILEQSSDSYYSMMQNITAAGTLGIITTVLIAPLFEEILFRGILVGDISKTHGAFCAVIASSLTFAIIHLNIAQMIPAFLGAIVFCYIYLVSKSIVAAVITHIVNNALSQIMFVAMPKTEYLKSVREMVTSDSIFYAIYGVSIFIFVIMIARLVIICIKDNKSEENIVLIDNNEVVEEDNSDEEYEESIKSDTVELDSKLKDTPFK